MGLWKSHAQIHQDSGGKKEKETAGCYTSVSWWFDHGDMLVSTLGARQAAFPPCFPNAPRRETECEEARKSPQNEGLDP